MTNDREFTKIVLKEVSELWRIPTSADKCISGDFSAEEFARSLQMLKPGKAPGPDSICPELIYPCRCCPEALGKQIPLFLHAPTKTSKNVKKSVSGCHPKPDEATRVAKLNNRNNCTVRAALCKPTCSCCIFYNIVGSSYLMAHAV